MTLNEQPGAHGVRGTEREAAALRHGGTAEHSPDRKSVV